MNTYTSNTMSDSDLTKFANLIKDNLINALFEEGLLETEDPRHLSGNYAIVLHRKGTLGTIWDKFRGIEPSPTALHIAVVKSVPGFEEEEKEK